MNSPYISTQPAFSRLQFLRGVGVALSLPLVDAMTPAFARTTAKVPPPRRLFRNRALLSGRDGQGGLRGFFRFSMA